jgi:hypothetical protein
MKLRILAALALAMTGANTFANAAMLKDLRGDVYVNHGRGFEKASGPVELGLGSAVMVSSGGAAQISYGDGCIWGVTPGGVTHVGVQSPCAQAKARMPKPSFVGAQTAPAIGEIVANQAPPTAGAPVEPPAPTQASGTPPVAPPVVAAAPVVVSAPIVTPAVLAVAGVVAAAAGGYALYQAQNPASP